MYLLSELFPGLFEGLNEVVYGTRNIKRGRVKIATIRLAVCNACSISLHYVSVFVCVSTNKHQRPSCADFKASRKKHLVLVAEKVLGIGSDVEKWIYDLCCRYYV